MLSRISILSTLLLCCVGSFPNLRGLVDPEASLVLLHSPSDWSWRLSAPLHVCKDSSCWESGARSTKESFTIWAILCMLILSLLPNSVYLRVRHVRQEIGEWRAWSKPWKGGVNFVRVGSVGYLQKGSKRVFWGCRSVLHLFHKWILVEILTKVPVVNTTNARWSDQGFHVQLD